ncbi:RnfABCDGE type electron transport complex subunit D [Frigidibacter sp. ROC022]|uniref:RnfABCDGE type electron transport complex subunit D n=1 Tax=Frigidibacter sp. ROC022 TaxID=2971796 RepID=UPI00215A553D|nr:RnfABCDGE type electron transport complex subunit D [Frigidibacter sp. ROC022]MCR8725539.1 RnfABCDGE type electron transport complex subunit D [Frigidibacter sp. ROC022]
MSLSDTPLPRISRPWDAHRVTLALCLALVLPLLAAGLSRGAALLPPLLLALALTLAWQAVFARLRQRAMSWDGIESALVFALLVPAGVPLWQQGLALSFGLVMGALIFGARGRGFLSPAVVGLSFLLITFPGIGPLDLGGPVALAALPAGAGLIWLGLLSWRVVAGFGLGAALLALLLAGPAALAQGLTSPALMLGLVFLIGDPVAGASTRLGRWTYGLLGGALAALFALSAEATLGTMPLQAMVSAALLASIFAPLLDQLAIWQNLRHRNRRHKHG